MTGKRKKIAYIAHPYRAKTLDEVAENIWHSRKVAKKYWRLGFAVFCPCLNSAFMDGTVTDDEFIAADLEFLKHADLFVLSGRWEKSRGCMHEYRFALKHKIKIQFDEGGECLFA